MRFKPHHFVFSILLISVLLPLKGKSMDATGKRQIEVSMRMIGHQILLNSGDSTSRVLPVQTENDRYKISFESDFRFNPEEIVATIDSVAIATGMAVGYMVEIENCETNEIVHAYVVGNLENPDVIPCRTRDQPKGCYSIFITILEYNEPSSPLQAEFSILLLVLSLLFIIGWAVFFWKKRKQSTPADSNIIRIGEYEFDIRNSELLVDDQKIELTSKESDLLLLLTDSANTTVERDVILKNVWGDEGDYIGRTLDVFISKLRKKLQADPTVKIANIRGIGYKLILNNPK